MNGYIDLYCERITPGVFAEPLNALTNLSFFVAAFFAYRLAEKSNRLDLQSYVLLFFLFAIGVGSTLFHSFASVLTLYLDVLPILFYQLAFIGIYAHSIIKVGWKRLIALYGLFMTLTVMSEQIPTSIMNGSLSYAPSILFILGFGVWHYKYAKSERLLLLAAACLFLVSISLRSVDMMVCSSFAIGTHFLWHMLNGCVLYLTTRSYITAR